MKNLMINGSPRKEGNTFLSLMGVEKGLKEAWMIKNLKERVVPQPTPKVEQYFICFIR